MVIVCSVSLAWAAVYSPCLARRTRDTFDIARINRTLFVRLITLLLVAG